VNGIHEVTGSIPVSSTNSSNKLANEPQPLRARRVSGGSVFARCAMLNKLSVGSRAAAVARAAREGLLR
jgi:hypothetical protein